MYELFILFEKGGEMANKKTICHVLTRNVIWLACHDQDSILNVINGKSNYGIFYSPVFRDD